MLNLAIALVFIGAGFYNWYHNGFSIVTMLLFALCCFVAGLLGGRVSNDDRNTQNLSELAQIERNRYLRKPEDK